MIHTTCNSHDRNSPVRKYPHPTAIVLPIILSYLAIRLQSVFVIPLNPSAYVIAYSSRHCLVFRCTPRLECIVAQLSHDTARMVGTTKQDDTANVVGVTLPMWWGQHASRGAHLRKSTVLYSTRQCGIPTCIVCLHSASWGMIST
jgi:hypothetical protein